jgi:hypothetical protein
MDLVALMLHVLAFVMPAVFVALCTTLVARWGARRAGAPRWWLQWAVCSAAGSAVLLAALWMLGRDGSVAGYAALVVCCGTVAWLLSRRGRA